LWQLQQCLHPCACNVVLLGVVVRHCGVHSGLRGLRPAALRRLRGEHDQRHEQLRRVRPRVRATPRDTQLPGFVLSHRSVQSGVRRLRPYPVQWV
jgi:hypothetical protein